MALSSFDAWRAVHLLWKILGTSGSWTWLGTVSRTSNKAKAECFWPLVSLLGVKRERHSAISEFVCLKHRNINISQKRIKNRRQMCTEPPVADKKWKLWRAKNDSWHPCGRKHCFREKSSETRFFVILQVPTASFIGPGTRADGMWRWKRSEFRWHPREYRWQHCERSRCWKTSILTRIRTSSSNLHRKSAQTFSNFGEKAFRCDSPPRWPWKPTRTLPGLRVLGTRPGRLHFASAYDDPHPFASDSGKKMFVRLLPARELCKILLQSRMFSVTFRAKTMKLLFLRLF